MPIATKFVRAPSAADWDVPERIEAVKDLMRARTVSTSVLIAGS